MMPGRRYFALSLFMSATVMAVEPLPQPLTFDYALSLAEAPHPELLLQQSAHSRSKAAVLGVDADNALSVSIEGRARWIKPPSIAADDAVTEDHKLSLFVRKPLYDFGYSSARYDAATQAELGAEQRYRAAIQQRRLQIMSAYFDVLLSDMEFARDNEALATAFISYDRLKTRMELGQASDIDVAELDSAYQQARVQINLSETRQRATRARLANVLGRPGMLPSEVRRPSLDYHQRKLPEYETVLQQAMANNLQIKALAAELEAAQRQLTAVQASGRPRLDAELEASDYGRELGGSDRWRAGVNLNIPLFTGGRVDAAVATQQAEVYRVQALLEQARYDLRQQVLDSWLNLQTLKLKRQKANKEEDFRELYLDRSRANYEMEFKADLGDAMVQLSRSQLEMARNDYEFALAWETLQFLTGGRFQDDSSSESKADSAVGGK